MKHALKWILSILLLLGIAAVAYFWANAQIDSNFNYRSILKDNPPASGENLGEPSTQRMVFVLIDALRYDTSLKTDVMPNLNHLREIGASALMHSQPPSFSEPGWSTLLIGAWPEINDGPVFNLEYDDIPAFTQDNLFTSAHRSGWKTAVSGYYWFEKMIPQSDVDFSFYTPDEDNAADEEVMKAALPWLTNNDAQLILIHLDQVDYAGHHEGGPQSPNWDAAAARTDNMLAQILTELDLSKDTIVVLSDHGQIDAGGHGGQDSICLLEPFIIAGAGVNPGQYADMQMVDVAPTLSALMGINLPASTQGEVKTAMLALPQSVTENLPDAVKAQQSALLMTYASAFDKQSTALKMLELTQVSDYQAVIYSLRTQKLFSDRIKRALPTALLLAVAITLLIRQRKNGSLAWLLGGLGFLLLFNLRYAVIDQKVFSLSIITSEIELIIYVAVTAAVSLVIVWLLVNLFKKTFAGSASENGLKTLYLGFTVVFIAGLPVLASYLINGPVVSWTLPDYLTSFLALLGLIQVLVVSALTPLLAGLTALITKLNHKG